MIRKSWESYREQVLRRESKSEIAPNIKAIAEKQARASHEGWMKGKIAQGYVYGPTTNDDPQKGPLTNPNLVPYDELSEETRRSNVANATAVLQIMQDKGCMFVSFTHGIIYPLAKEIHDEWCREKFQNGWQWGPITDKAKKIHRDLVPFETLAMDPELVGDIAYDVDTAKEIIIKMIVESDIFPLIMSTENFKLELEKMQ